MVERPGKLKPAEHNGVFRIHRRAHRRYVLVQRTALLHTDEGREPCLVRNISAGGMMGRIYRKASLGDEVHLELRANELIAGSVLWVQEWDFGVQFRNLIDVEPLLNDQWVTEQGQRLRGPRVEVRCPAKLRVRARPMKGIILDISEGGAKVETHTPLNPNDRLTIAIPDLPPLAAAVRWTDAFLAGVAFEEPVPFEVLADWLRERSAR